MLQKTLLNVEGLGRELDPNLDLWQTAQPVLERWMSEQMGWRSVFKRIKNEAPFWAELLPTLPRKLDTFLSRDNHKANALEAELAALKKHQQQQKQMIHVLLATVIALTVLSAWLLKG